MYDPYTITHIDSEVFQTVFHLLKDRKFKRENLHTLTYEFENVHHNEDEYLGTRYIDVSITRQANGMFLTFRRSYETDFDCTYTHYIFEERITNEFLIRKINRYLAGKDIREVKVYRGNGNLYDC